MSVPYVHSGYERRADDHYPTVDGRLLEALQDTWDIGGRIIDCCAPQGSGIVDWLRSNGLDAHCEPTAFGGEPADWLVTNPPYLRGLVDGIARVALARLRRREVHGVAFLTRASWDLANCRADLFERPWYAGQTRMRFRPWWSEDRKAQPIHNFCWHVWMPGPRGEPVVRYWSPSQ